MLTWTCFLGLALYMFISTAVNGRVIGCPLRSEYIDEWVDAKRYNDDGEGATKI